MAGPVGRRTGGPPRGASVPRGCALARRARMASRSRAGGGDAGPLPSSSAPCSPGSSGPGSSGPGSSGPGSSGPRLVGTGFVALLRIVAPLLVARPATGLRLPGPRLAGARLDDLGRGVRSAVDRPGRSGRPEHPGPGGGEAGCGAVAGVHGSRRHGHRFRNRRLGRDRRAGPGGDLAGGGAAGAHRRPVGDRLDRIALAGAVPAQGGLVALEHRSPLGLEAVGVEEVGEGQVVGRLDALTGLLGLVLDRVHEPEQQALGGLQVLGGEDLLDLPPVGAVVAPPEGPGPAGAPQLATHPGPGVGEGVLLGLVVIGLDRRRSGRPAGGGRLVRDGAVDASQPLEVGLGGEGLPGLAEHARPLLQGGGDHPRVPVRPGQGPVERLQGVGLPAEGPQGDGPGDEAEGGEVVDVVELVGQRHHRVCCVRWPGRRRPGRSRRPRTSAPARAPRSPRRCARSPGAARPAAGPHRSGRAARRPARPAPGPRTPAGRGGTCAGSCGSTARHPSPPPTAVPARRAAGRPPPSAGPAPGRRAAAGLPRPRPASGAGRGRARPWRPPGPARPGP